MLWLTEVGWVDWVEDSAVDLVEGVRSIDGQLLDLSPGEDYRQNLIACCRQWPPTCSLGRRCTRSRTARATAASRSGNSGQGPALGRGSSRNHGCFSSPPMIAYNLRQHGCWKKTDLWHLHLREGLRSTVSLHATVVAHPTLSIVVTLTFVSIDYNI